jgi:hypothetical protein
MAFQTSRSQNQNQTNSFRKPEANTTAVSSDKKKSDTINISGAYEGKPDSKLVLKGMALKEAVTIPAGFTVKVFVKGGVSKNGKQLPQYEIVAQPPRAK